MLCLIRVQESHLFAQQDVKGQQLEGTDGPSEIYSLVRLLIKPASHVMASLCSPKSLVKSMMVRGTFLLVAIKSRKLMRHWVVDEVLVLPNDRV